MIIRPATVAALLGVVLFVGCAQTGPLTGGAANSTPPEVVQTTPSQRTTLFTGSYVNLRFEDYVDRGVRNAIRIQPSVPFFVSYSGDEVDVEFRETLAPATTYVLTVGTSYTSRYGTAPSQAFTLVFATGNAIDTGRIAGSVRAASTTGFEVFCLPVVSDSVLDVRLASPPYRVPVGSSGAFAIEGLRDGIYRIVAVRDANSNGLLDADEDYATATANVEVQNGTSPKVVLRPIAPIDSTGPYILRARAVASRTIELRMSEPIDKAIARRFAITDSASGAVVRTDTVVIPRSGKDRPMLRLLDSLGNASFVLTVSDSAAFDAAGNSNLDTLRVHAFVGSNRADSLHRRQAADTTARPPSTHGSVTGVLIDSSGIGGPLLLRVFDDKGALAHTISVKPMQVVQIDSIAAGEYRLDVVVDSNNNGRYDAGSVHPWRDAEIVIDLPLALTVRPRWTQEGIRFVIPRTEQP